MELREGYKSLIVWQRSMELVVDVYKITKLFPEEEKFGIVSQMRRASISIPSNIAEGSRRGKKDFQRFLRIAFGSASELETQLETQLEISKQLSYIKDTDTDILKLKLNEVSKMLNKMINY